MAFLIAVPACPINIPNPLQRVSIEIRWDSDAANGRVTQQETSPATGQEIQVDPVNGPPVRTGGRVNVSIEVGKQYLFRLYNAAGTVLMTVSCAGQRPGGPGQPRGLATEIDVPDISHLLAKAGIIQAILGLEVLPSPGAIIFRFKTSQESVPIIQIADAPPKPDGSGVMRFDSWHVIKTSWPVLQGLKTQHHLRVTGLENDTDYWYLITADGREAGPGDDAQRWGTARTNARSIRVFFDGIRVWRDSDPGGKGEMFFEIAVYGGGGSPLLGGIPNWIGSAGDGDWLPLKRTVASSTAPKTIGIYAYGEDDDSWGVAAALGLQGVTYGPPQSAPPTGFDETTYTTWCRVYQEFDLPDDVVDEPYVQPFTIDSPNGGVKFTVYGNITMLPTTFTSQGASPKRSIPSYAQVDARSGSQAIATRRSAHFLAVSAHDTLFHRVIAPDPDRPRQLDWMPIGEGVRAPVTSIASHDESIDLFSIDRYGAVIHKWFDDREWKPSLGDWSSLGGSFAGTVSAAAVQGTRRIHLVALNPDGVAFHREIRRGDDAEADPWRDVGGRLTGVVALVATSDRLELFAMGPEREILYKSLRANDWVPAKKEWRRIGGPFHGPVTAQPTRDGRLAVVVLGDRRQVHALEWDSAAGRAKGDWEDLGSIDELQNSAR